MSSFPTLKTGAIQQYPAQRASQLSTRVVRFIDGSEQRFGNYAEPIRQWVVQVELLDETELHVLREFFRTNAGPGGTFSFTDPWDGSEYPSCSFEKDEMAEDLTEESKGRTTLIVRENRG